MSPYEQSAAEELASWKVRMQRPPSFGSLLIRRLQIRINRAIPDKVHEIITAAIREMTRVVLSGAGFTTARPLMSGNLEERELRVRKRIEFYRTAAAAEGAVTGGGGILLGLADFPLWLMLKMKMLFDIASLYGCDVSDQSERIFILRVFELAFSHQAHRGEVFDFLAHWESAENRVRSDTDDFDWRSFQQEYRDSIDVAKLLQLVPGIGAAVGAFVNHRLTDRLGTTAMNAYRMRRALS